MGTWGAALYDDDTASDLRDTVALVTRVPGNGERLLSLIRQVHGEVDPEDEDAAIFWLVVADLFEKKGIACPEATAHALRIIESGQDLAACASRGADERFLKARGKVLLELAGRLRSPRPTKPPKRPGKPPPLVLAEGQIHAFPTMSGSAWHPYRLDTAGPFVPDGWGALVVLATGRAFEWLPWVAITSLTVKGDVRPSLVDALDGRLIHHPQTAGAGRFIPKPAHAKGLGLELLGTVDLDPARVAPHLSARSIEAAIRFDWTIAYGAIACNPERDAQARVALRRLLRKGSVQGNA